MGRQVSFVAYLQAADVMVGSEAELSRRYPARWRRVRARTARWRSRTTSQASH